MHGGVEARHHDIQSARGTLTASGICSWSQSETACLGENTQLIHIFRLVRASCEKVRWERIPNSPLSSMVPKVVNRLKKDSQINPEFMISEKALNVTLGFQLGSGEHGAASSCSFIETISQPFPNSPQTLPSDAFICIGHQLHHSCLDT